jgi:hypothetical protein
MKKKVPEKFRNIFYFPVISKIRRDFSRIKQKSNLKQLQSSIEPEPSSKIFLTII